MIALGIDYGTTNSLIIKYAEESKKMMKKEIVKAYTISEIVDNNGEIINSPKRLLNDINNINQEQVSGYIATCIKNLIGQIREQIYKDSEMHIAITIPNAFKDTQCNFLKKAIANVFADEFPETFSIHLIPEPVSAALYYAYCLKSTEQSGTCYIVVSDIGGGTTDLAVVKLTLENRILKFKVICTEQDASLGGNDIDEALSTYIKSKYRLDNNIVEDNDLLKASRFIKERLSVLDNVRQSLLNKNQGGQKEIYNADGEPLRIDVSRREFEDVVMRDFIEKYKELLQRLVEVFKEQLKNSEGYKETELEEVIKKCVLLPIGGTSRVPFIQKTLQDFFAGNILFTLNAEGQNNDDASKFDSVSRGAAIYAAHYAGLTSQLCNKIIIENRTLHKFSIRYADEKVFTLVEKTMPDGEYKKLFHPKFLSEDGQSFSLEKLEIYQGGRDNDCIDEDCRHIETIDAPDTIMTNGKSKDEIDITLTIAIKSGRLDFVKVYVPDGCGAGKNYEKIYTLTIWEE